MLFKSRGRDKSSAVGTQNQSRTLCAVTANARQDVAITRLPLGRTLPPALPPGIGIAGCRYPPATQAPKLASGSSSLTRRPARWFPAVPGWSVNPVHLAAVLSRALGRQSAQTAAASHARPFAAFGRAHVQHRSRRRCGTWQPGGKLRSTYPAAERRGLPSAKHGLSGRPLPSPLRVAENGGRKLRGAPR